MVVHVILKNQVTSYFRKKNVTAITTVITDVWRKGWARIQSDGASCHSPDDSEAGSATAACRGTGTMGRHERRRRNMPGKALARILQDYGIREALERRSNIRSWPCRHWYKSWTDPSRVPERRAVATRRVRWTIWFRTISGLTKILVRLAMTWHTWSRILMEYVSSSCRHRK